MPARLRLAGCDAGRTHLAFFEWLADQKTAGMALRSLE